MSAGSVMRGMALLALADAGLASPSRTYVLEDRPYPPLSRMPKPMRCLARARRPRKRVVARATIKAARAANVRRMRRG